MKTILVTGAGPGFGRAVAQAFAAAGLAGRAALEKAGAVARGAILPLSVRRPLVTIPARHMPHIGRG